MNYHHDVGLQSLDGIDVHVCSLRCILVGPLPRRHAHQREANSCETKADANKPGAVVEPLFNLNCTFRVASSIPLQKETENVTWPAWAFGLPTLNNLLLDRGVLLMLSIALLGNFSVRVWLVSLCRFFGSLREVVTHQVTKFSVLLKLDEYSG